ncbi:DNA alkylation repair protein [Marisediminicola sp. LYQ134]|uniref:DNA alkylation repair protein n=1 Tax=Marisediminicola sp. LYQ134 TaxID=3391061 RepID=UPI003983411E
MAETTVDTVLADLAALDDPRMREVNASRGDDHGVNLTKLRGLAKAIKTDHDLATALWATGDTAARLVAILVSRPKAFTADELDAMVRQSRSPKVHDWLVSYVVKKSPHTESLRVAWFDDDDPTAASAAWSLTSDAVVTRPETVDIRALLDTIENEMRDAPDRVQWAMNTTLAMIGIHHPEHRARALDIGERLGVLRDYPTPPNCTSPFAPLWIGEMVRRQNT